MLLFLFSLHFSFYGKEGTQEEEINRDYGNFPERPSDTTAKKIPQELEIKASDLDIQTSERAPADGI